MKISERLKQLRTLHGLKLREVSLKTGLSISYISDLERGRQNPSLQTCQKFATIYELTLSKMFEEEESINETPNETPCAICGYPEYKHSAITHEFEPML